MSDKKLELIDPATGKKVLLPVRSGTVGPSVVDIAPLAKDLGAFTYDPGYGATAAVESKITYIDGDAGVLTAPRLSRSSSSRRRARSWRLPIYC